MSTSSTPSHAKHNINPNGLANDPVAFDNLLKSINTISLLESGNPANRPAVPDNRSRFFSNNMFGTLVDDDNGDDSGGEDEETGGGVAVGDSASKKGAGGTPHGKGERFGTPQLQAHLQMQRALAEESIPRIPVGPSNTQYNNHANNRFPRGRNFYEDQGPRHGGGFGYRGGYHRNTPSHSQTWQSPEQKQLQEFVLVRNAMRRLFKNAEVSKWKLTDYVAHQKEMLISKQNYTNRVLAAREAASRSPTSSVSTLDDYCTSLRDQVIANLHVEGNISLVLGEKTIWCQDWENGKDEIAEWPTHAEMKWEGDDRAKTAVGRFLPLPREMGAPGIVWSQLQVVEQYPLDQVCRIPTMEDIYAPVDEIDDDVKYNFLTHDLEDAMDAFLET